MERKMLNLKEIKKDYVTASETVNALKGVSIAFRQSEFVSILGPSGCGKTTLLNIIGGLDHYTDGDLVINGRSTKSYTDRDWDVYRNHRVGFIFQSYNLIPHQTILGNVELALTIAGMSKEERIEKAKKALDRVGLAGQYYKKPNQLSGGQCQRVAIARALVNDPEILLADEPTGALDTVTSVQIMDLIKEISGERLVIMVTHNPELAEQYSTRIVRLLDGNLLEDSNPFSPEDEEAESLRLVAEEEARIKEAENAAIAAGASPKKAAKKVKEKAKMSLFTAFMLSARNLLSKKGRTAMVGIAGSIGIIGIALVLAFSAGIKGYISSMQDDMLSGNPIEIAEVGLNASALSDIMGDLADSDIEKLADKVYITSTVENLAQMSANLEKLFAENTITKEYVDYVKAMPTDAYEAMLLSYGINMAFSLFTDFSYDKNGEVPTEHISVQRLIDIYTSVLKETDYKNYASFIPYLVPSMQQAPNNPDYILSQYDLLGGGEIADEAHEIMLVLNPNEEISDLLLAVFGYYTQDEFLAIVDKATAENPDDYNSKSLYREYFEYSELIGKEFTWYPADTLFTKTEGDFAAQMMNGSYKYNSKFEGEDIGKGGTKLKVVGILAPKENVSYGSLSSGIYYTEALTNYMLEANASSSYINDYLTSDLAAKEIGAKTFTIPNPDDSANPTIISLNYSYIYNYTFRFDNPKTLENEAKDADGNYIDITGMGVISPKKTTMSPAALMGLGSSAENTLTDSRDSLIRNLAGNNLANNILIFPKSFDEKDSVTRYLDAWSDPNAEIYVGDVLIPAEERVQVTYTDTLELVINMINTMIDIISYALIAFTSVSLVVSTVMIGIITYVSVVERIKEIGVIRSLGGRKKDVSHLFNAETFIIGLFAGLFGVFATYFISLIVNIILKPLIGYGSIAALPVGQAILMVTLSVTLTLISGIIPASSAAKKDPVVALRTE